MRDVRIAVARKGNAVHGIAHALERAPRDAGLRHMIDWDDVRNFLAGYRRLQ